MQPNLRSRLRRLRQLSPSHRLRLLDRLDRLRLLDRLDRLRLLDPLHLLGRQVLGNLYRQERRRLSKFHCQSTSLQTPVS
jgi:hypothetical protein